MGDFLNFLKESLLGGRRADISQEKLDGFKKDIVGQNTSWDPLKKGGWNFQTHALIETDGIMRYRTKIFTFFGGIIFVSIWLAVISTWRDIAFADLREIVPSIIGISVISFICVGICIFITRRNRCWIFDKYSGYCYLGSTLNTTNNKKAILIPQIHGIQIIPEWIPGKSSFISYEINFVLKDFSRINIMDHEDIKKIREDAEKIGGYLGVPVWDVTS